MEFVKRLLIQNDLKNNNLSNTTNNKNDTNKNVSSVFAETISKYKSKNIFNTKIEKEINIECLNIMELSKKFKNVKETYFTNEVVFFNQNKMNIDSNSQNKEKSYNVEIYLYKKLSKEKIVCEILINKYLIKLDYITTFLMKATKKTQKRDFCGNLIEEIISLFNPIKDLKLYSDSINFIESNMYTLKNIVKQVKSEISNKNLVLNNLFFNLQNESEIKYLKDLSQKVADFNKENFSLTNVNECNNNNKNNNNNNNEISKIKSRCFFDELKINFYLKENENIKTFFEEIIEFMIKTANYYSHSITNNKINLNTKNEKIAFLEFMKKPKIRNINLCIYFDFDKLLLFNNNSNEIEGDNLFDGLLEVFEKKLELYTLDKISFFYFKDISLEFININPCSKVVSDNKFKAVNNLAKFFLLNFIPNSLQLNIVEIMNKNNSNLTDKQALFKYIKVKFSTEFSNVFNKLKLTNLFLKANNKSRKHLIITIFSFLENIKIEPSKENTVTKIFSLFENDTKFLQVNLELIKNKKTTEKNSKLAEIANISKETIDLNLNTNTKKDVKLIFNLKQNLDNIFIRKVKTENIYKIITEKPTNNNNDNDANEVADKLENLINLKPHDLATISDIFSKIEGNKIFFLKDGRKVSIGGKFNLTIYGNSFQIILNTIFEISSDVTKMRIFTYNDNYFLPIFNFAAEKFDFINLLKDEKNKKEKLAYLNEIDLNSKSYKKINGYLLGKIIEFNKITNLKDLNFVKNNSIDNIFNELIFTSGGMSQQEFISNFYFTPIYIINSSNFDIYRVFPDKDVFQMFPGVLFNHEIRICIENNKILIDNIGGFRIENYVGGIKIGESKFFNLLIC